MIRFSNNDNKLIQILKNLPSGYWDFKTENTKSFTHGLHNYPAMMVCPISRNIIRLLKEIYFVESLFDPFAGSGTVLVEGMLGALRNVSGNDLNPLALFLTLVKTTPINSNVLNKEKESLFNRIEKDFFSLIKHIRSIDFHITHTLGLDITGKKGWGENAPTILKQYCNDNKLDVHIPDFKNLGYWFKPRVILELSVIKRQINKIESKEVRDFCNVALSECIRFVSNRGNGEFKMFRIPVSKIQKFNPDVIFEFRRIFNRNISKLNEFTSAVSKNSKKTNVHIFRNDSCVLEDVPDNFYDLIITSHPYGDSRTTVAYGEFSRLLLQWLELLEFSCSNIMKIDSHLMGGKKFNNIYNMYINSKTLEKSLDRIYSIDNKRAGEVFSFYKDLDEVLKNVSMKTRTGGYHFWVVGNRTVKGEILQTDLIIQELAPQYHLTPIFNIERNIPNKVMPSQNSPSNIKGVHGVTMTMEHIVVLRKD